MMVWALRIVIAVIVSFGGVAVFNTTRAAEGRSGFADPWTPFVYAIVMVAIVTVKHFSLRHRE